MRPRKTENTKSSDHFRARITVDTTMQSKNVTHPTDAKLMLRAIEQFGGLAKRHGMESRHHRCPLGYPRIGLAQRYIHSKQFKSDNRELGFLDMSAFEVHYTKR